MPASRSRAHPIRPGSAVPARLLHANRRPGRARAPADVERWLDEARAPTGYPHRPRRRHVVGSPPRWTAPLRRADPLILDPALALIAWVHFAPPIGDAFRSRTGACCAGTTSSRSQEILTGRGRAPDPDRGAADRDGRPRRPRIAIARSLAIADRLLEDRPAGCGSVGASPTRPGASAAAPPCSTAITRSSASSTRRGRGARRAGDAAPAGADR